MRPLIAAAVAAAVAVSAVATPAVARPRTDGVTVKVHPRATLDDGAQWELNGLFGRVMVSCPPTHEVASSFVTLLQSGGRFGTGAISRPECTGHKRWYEYRGAAFHQRLHPGHVLVSAHLIVTAPDGTHVEVTGSRPVKAR